MTVIKKILWLLEVLLLLGLAVGAGVAGLGFGPPEVTRVAEAAFAALGLPPLGVQIFAGAQIAAGAFLLLLPTRRTGCLLLIALFAAEAVGLFLAGQQRFAPGGIVGIAMVMVPLIWVSPRRFGEGDIYT